MPLCPRNASEKVRRKKGFAPRRFPFREAIGATSIIFTISASRSHFGEEQGNSALGYNKKRYNIPGNAVCGGNPLILILENPLTHALALGYGVKIRLSREYDPRNLNGGRFPALSHSFSHCSTVILKKLMSLEPDVVTLRPNFEGLNRNDTPQFPQI